MTEPIFIVDINVAKLARLLRMLGFDAVLFGHESDDRLIRAALDEDRILLTRDTRIMERGVVTGGRLAAILITSDQPQDQIRQVVERLGLDGKGRPFSRCLECNSPLVAIAKEGLADRVPPYVFRTQREFVECGGCQRVYWKGSHWQAMLTKLAGLAGPSPEED